jgi:hypothetical protein
MLYTSFEFLEDIQTIPEKCVKDTPEGAKANRDFMHKLKVLQSFFWRKLPPYDFKDDNMDAIKEALEVSVDGDELLFGYTYFLSSNTNFDYSWNYLRMQMDNYIDFYSEAYRFISYVLKDIDELKANLCGLENLHIYFNELFDVTFIDDKPFVKTIVNWESFYQINKVKNGYYLSVKIDKTTLLTFYRKYNNKLNPNISRINQILATWKDQTEKNKA